MWPTLSQMFVVFQLFLNQFYLFKQTLRWQHSTFTFVPSVCSCFKEFKQLTLKYNSFCIKDDVMAHKLDHTLSLSIQVLGSNPPCLIRREIEGRIHKLSNLLSTLTHTFLSQVFHKACRHNLLIDSTDQRLKDTLNCLSL